MTDVIDSILIGSLSTYLPFWILDNTAQSVILAIGLSILVYAGKLWQMERAEKRKKKRSSERQLKRTQKVNSTPSL